MTLLRFCQITIRAGSSRGLAYQQWRKYHATGWEEFASYWKAARELEAMRKERAA